MLLLDLKKRIQETLGLDVISLPGLVSLVNNCMAVIESKEYREYAEDEVTGSLTMPYSIDIPTATKRILYVKIKTDEGVFKCQRIGLTDPTLQSRIQDGVYRTESASGLIFYVKDGKIIIDATFDKEILAVYIGRYKTMEPLAFGITEDQLNGTNGATQTVVPIRQGMESAFVFYGLEFYANRYKFRPETIDAYNKMFKYYVEDILTQLDREDAYLSEDDIETVISL